MKTVPLTQDKVALVDDEDFLRVSQYKWYAIKMSHLFYAHTNVRKADGKTTILSMHVLLLPDAKRVDHQDGNGLNNQRHNLRSATHSQNMANRRKHKNGTSSLFKGVHWHKAAKKFTAQICVNHKRHHLGLFTSETDAAMAYDVAALHHFGAFARLNLPDLKAAA